MEKGFRSSLLQPDVQLSNANTSALPFDLGLQTSPGVNSTVFMNGNYPINGLLLPPRAEEPHGWFHCLPWLGQSFVSGENMVLDEKLLCGREHPEQAQATTSGCFPKQFLVFDQSGDKITLIYSSVNGVPISLNSGNSSSRSPCHKFNNSDRVKLEIWSGMHGFLGPNLSDELNANYSEAEVRSDVGEDEEEIDALLYSDDEYDDDDEEMMSTGHSPSMITAYNDDELDSFEEEDGEDFASSGGPTKRRRISQDEYDSPSLTATASSTRPDRTTSQQEDNADSKCAGDPLLFTNYDEDGSMCGMKRSRKESIRETVEILRSIIPGGKSKNLVVVLDESIRYLKSLKLKAKSLGLVAL